MLAPKFVQCFTFQWPARDNALRFGSIDNFPQLADSFAERQFFSEKINKLATAPNALLEDRLEAEGSCDYGLRHGCGKRPTLNAQRPTLNSETGCFDSRPARPPL